MHSEDTVNVGSISDAYLDVRLAAKPGIGVYVFPLGKNATDGIERLVAGLFPCKMEEIDDCAVELAKTKIVAAGILRHLRAGGGDDPLKTCICRFHGMDAIGTDEVQAESGIDHSTDNERFDLSAALFQDSVCALFRPLQSPIRVGFPKIDPGSEPVIGVFTRLEGFVQKQTFTCLPIAAVISENK
jgi:hypothetical protein